MADGKVTISTALDNRGLERGIRGISGSLGGLRSVLGLVGKAVAAAFTVRQLAQFGAACIELGSSVAEVQNVVDTAFGSMAWEMEQFADTAITSYGMSELAAKKTGSTYMAMARGLGLAEDAASDMAIALTGLSGDVASFFNMTQEEADTKLRSIFTGETEALKELGVVMTQANLQQYALAHGMNANIAAMSQSEQVALRYAFVTDALKLASGDFLKTQNSWANQTRILSMQWQQFMSIIGQALTTILLPTVRVLNSIVSGLISIANAFHAAVTAIFGGQQSQIAGMTDANAAIGASAQGAAAGEQALADSTRAAGKAAKGALASFDQLNVLQQQDPGGGAGGAAAGPGAGGMTFAPVASEETKAVPPVLEKIKALMEQLKALFAPSIRAWGSAWDTLRAKAAKVWPEIQNGAQDLWNNGLLPLTGYLTQTFVPSVVNAFSEAFAPIVGGVLSGAMQIFADNFVWWCGIITDAINSVVLPALELLRGVWADMMAGLAAVWAEYGQPLVENLVLLFENIRTILTSLWETLIRPFLEYLIENLGLLWENHLKPLWDNLIGLFADLWMTILTFLNEVLLPLVNFLVQVLGPVFEKIFETVGSVVMLAVGVIADTIDIAVTAFRGLLQFLADVFQGDWAAAWQTVQDTVSSVWDGIRQTIKGTVNVIIDIINGMISAMVGGLNAVVRAMNSFKVDIPSWLPGIGGKKLGFSLPEIHAPQIPYLAQGAVLPPNRPFLAMVGDQPSGTNVEAPIETIKQALAEVLGSVPAQEIVIRFAASGGLAELVRLLKPYIDRENNRVGAKLIKGGVY